MLGDYRIVWGGRQTLERCAVEPFKSTIGGATYWWEMSMQIIIDLQNKRKVRTEWVTFSVMYKILISRTFITIAQHLLYIYITLTWIC